MSQRLNPRVVAVGAFAAALTAVLAGLVIDMSGSAPRTAGSDHVPPATFVVTMRGGQTACQPTTDLPDDAAVALMVAGSYGRPLPRLSLRFLSSTGTLTAFGAPAPGAHEGTVPILLHHLTGAPVPNRFCINDPTGGPLAIGGVYLPAGPQSARVDGKSEAGLMSLVYYRAGSESWLLLLPVLGHRFGLGRASFFGDWTLPVCGLALIAVWVAAVRLMWRERP